MKPEEEITARQFAHFPKYQEDYIANVAQDTRMHETVESQLLSLLDHYHLWPQIVDFVARNFYLMDEQKAGRPPEITTGLRDLLLWVWMHVYGEKAGIRATAKDLSAFFKDSGFWQDSDETLYRHFKRLQRKHKEGLLPSLGMLWVAYGLCRLRAPRR